MSTSAIVGDELDKQAALASAALGGTSGVGPRAVLDVLGPYSAALYIVERVGVSDVFNAELVRAVHSKLLPLEHMADGMLKAAREHGHFDDPDIVEPLRWLETCNEQVKDCMVALEAMLDPELDDLMDAAMEERQQGETVPLESIR
jgi:hypothetical protein